MIVPSSVYHIAVCTTFEAEVSFAAGTAFPIDQSELGDFVALEFCSR